MNEVRWFVAIVRSIVYGAWRIWCNWTRIFAPNKTINKKRTIQKWIGSEKKPNAKRKSLAQHKCSVWECVVSLCLCRAHCRQPCVIAISSQTFAQRLRDVHPKPRSHYYYMCFCTFFVHYWVFFCGSNNQPNSAMKRRSRRKNLSLKFVSSFVWKKKPREQKRSPNQPKMSFERSIFTSSELCTERSRSGNNCRFLRFITKLKIHFELKFITVKCRIVDIVHSSFTGRCGGLCVCVFDSVLPFAELFWALWLRSLYWTWINIVIWTFDSIYTLCNAHHSATHTINVWCCEGTASRRQHKCTKFEIVCRAHSFEIKAEYGWLERGWRLVPASEIESQTKRCGDNDEKVAVYCRNVRMNERNKNHET